MFVARVVCTVSYANALGGAVSQKESAVEVTIKSLPIHYEEIGEGIPLFLLHGLGIDHRHIQADMEPLFAARSGWRRIYPDLPGMGKTSSAEWIKNDDDVLEILKSFVRELAPNRRFVLAGTSYGGYLVRGLVHEMASLVDGVLLMMPMVEMEESKKIIPPRQVLVEDRQFLEMIRPDEGPLRDLFVVQSPAQVESFRTVIQPALPLADQTFLKRLNEHLAFSFEVDRLESPFPGPTLTLTGRQDSLVGYRNALSLLENFPRGTFAVLDRSGHALCTEQEGLFRALTSEWLDRVEEWIRRTG